MPSAAFLIEMDRKRGSSPRTKIEHISKTDVTTDITRYFMEGANLETVKERAPDEIQSGEFDVVMSNHDDTFSEYKSGSLFFEVDYHGSRIRISEGFLLPDGTTEYEVQGVGYIDQIISAPEVSKVTIRCRDLLWRVMDQNIRTRPLSEIPVAGSNTGNGIIGEIATKPWNTVNEDWMITCTLGGDDGVATFSVVGSVSGGVGTATSGTEFTASNNTIRFTIKVGSIFWVVADSFTFSTKQAPEWNGVNAGKIIWSILTGYNWDTDTVENWAGLVFNYDHTKSSANTELDYDSFVDSIDNINTIGFFNLKGFVPYDQDAIEYLQGLLTLVLGSLFTGNDGRIKFKTYIPIFGSSARSFTDAKKISSLTYNRSIDEVINSVVVLYKAIDTWPWSNDDIVLDGVHTDKSSSSITKYFELPAKFEIPWYTASGQHVQDFADKLTSKYSEPPLNVGFKTGMDALTVEIGDRVTVEDTKLGLALIGEVAVVGKDFDQEPAAINLMVRHDAEIDQQFGFIGSEIDEGDGLSPQDEDFDTATDSDKGFCYFGSIATSTPDYRMY